MLPKPDCAFVIPNINDDLELSCRLYFPKSSSKSSSLLITGFAIFAHPYAPLGGCYDDPVVQTVGYNLLKQGFVLCTFNFRGAAGSSGSTSWTGKAELADYVSVYIFMLQLIDNSELSGYVSLVEGKPLLLLGGYSYGSMIASHLPDVQFIQEGTKSAQPDSADHEIKLRAQEIAKVLLGYLETQIQRGRNTERFENGLKSPTSMRGVMMGGSDADGGSRRASRDSSRRSIDIERVRHSIERVRHKFNPRAGSDSGVQLGETHRTLPEDEIRPAIDPRIAYLLVSPILQIVAGFTTVFSRLVFERKNAPARTRPPKQMLQNLAENPTLAVYGDKDIFTSSRRLRKWSQELQTSPNSRFSSEEVTGAGHFWHEHDALQKLQLAINTWLISITSAPSQTLADS